MLESTLKDLVIDFLTELEVWFENIDSVAVRGIPDFLCCIRGYFVAIELKASENKAWKDLSKSTPLQIYKLSKVALLEEGIGIVIYPENWEELKPLLTNLKKGTENDRNKLRNYSQTWLREWMEQNS